MAYRSSQQEREQAKIAVIRAIAPNEPSRQTNRAEWVVGDHRVHVRFCAGRPKFNINPTTLQTDWELWICGNETHWYLIPMSVIRAMHDHPLAYPDNRNPDYTVGTIDADEHKAKFAQPSVTDDLRPYFRQTLPGTKLSPKA